MDIDGQAEQAPSTIGDVADFLQENLDAVEGEPQEPEHSDNSAADQNPDEGSDPEEQDGPNSEEEDAPEAKPEPTSQKFTVTVKGEDGADQQIEVDQKELISGYQRHADYTRKAMELGERERQAVEVMSRHVNEARQNFQQEAQKARQAVLMLAGLRSEQEMADLAVQNPTAWVQERHRADQIHRVLSQLDQASQQQTQEAQRQQQEAQQRSIAAAWVELEKDGLDRNKLAGIFQGVSKQYRIEPEKFAQITDPRLVRIMRDAMAYQDLKTKTVPAKKAAPALPAGRQSAPQETQRSKKLEARFRSGNAGIKDLASLIESMNQ